MGHEKCLQLFEGLFYKRKITFTLCFHGEQLAQSLEIQAGIVLNLQQMDIYKNLLGKKDGIGRNRTFLFLKQHQAWAEGGSLGLLFRETDASDEGKSVSLPKAHCNLKITLCYDPFGFSIVLSSQAYPRHNSSCSFLSPLSR